MHPATVLLILSTLFAHTATAGVPGSITLYYIGDVTQGEFNALPSFCQKLVEDDPELFTGKSLTPEEQAQVRGIGGGHHYCSIPVLRGRFYREQKPNIKSFLLERIIDEANYVIGHSQPDAPLLANTYLEKARALLDSGQEAKAIVEYMNAIRANPGFTSPYLDMARIHVRLNNKLKALALVSEGLKHNPDSKALQKRYVELGGQLPYPPPYAGPNTQTLQRPEQETSIDVTSSRPSMVPDIKSKSDPGLDIPVQEINTPKSESGKLPVKSFCRFCPEP